MRPITRRLRLFAAALAVAQVALPALALAHDLAGAGRALQAHAESQGTTHDLASHSHECGNCRHLVSKHGLAGAPQPSLCDIRAGGTDALNEGQPSVRRDAGAVALPRGPPVG